MSCRQGGDKTTTYVLPTRWRQNYYLCLTNKVEKTTTYINVCLTDKVETKLLHMSHRQGRDITNNYVFPTRWRQTTTYVLPTRWRHNYYLCIVDKGETYLLPMSSRQDGDKTTTHVLLTRWRQHYYLCLADKGEI